MDQDPGDETEERRIPVRDGWHPGENVIRAAIKDVLETALDLRRVELAIGELAPELPLDWRARLAKLIADRGPKAVRTLFS